MQDFLRLDTN